MIMIINVILRSIHEVSLFKRTLNVGKKKREEKVFKSKNRRFPIDSLIVLRKNNFKKTTLSQCWRKTSSKVTFRKIISFLIPNAFNTNILGLTFTTFEVLSFQSWNCRVVDFHKYCKLYFLQFHCMEMQVALICLDHNQQTIYRLHCCHFDHNWRRAFLQTVRHLSFTVISVLRNIYVCELVNFSRSSNWISKRATPRSAICDLTFSSHRHTRVPTNLVRYFPKKITAAYQRGTGVPQATLKANIVPKANHCNNILY